MFKHFRDFLRSLFELVEVVGWWLMIVGLIVLAWLFDHCVIVI